MLLVRFGKSFSEHFFTRLTKRDPDADYLCGSYQLPADTGHDLFISYRGETGRLFMWLALVGQFNLPPGMVWLCVVCPLLVVILVFTITDPCEENVPKILLGPLQCTIPGDVFDFFNAHFFVPPFSSPFVQLQPYIVAPESLFAFLPYASLALVVVVLFWFPATSRLMHWLGRPYRVFYDKFCLHQSNPSKGQPGLQRLCLYLRHSAAILCLFDVDYVDRLWCVFEFAVYLKLCPNPKVTFVSVSQRSVEVITIVLNNISYALIGWVMYVQVNQSVRDSGTLDAEDGFGGFLPPYHFCQLVVVRSMIFILGQQHFRSLDKLRKTVATFDVRKCSLGVEEDRSFLVGFITDVFGPSVAASANAVRVPNQSVISHFNDEVREMVRFRLPLSGVRSSKIFSYSAAVLAFSSIALWPAYDYNSYNDDTRVLYNSGFWYAFNGVFFNFVYLPLVLIPVNAWAQSAIIYICWRLQRHLCSRSGWSYKFGMAIGLPVYLLVDVIFPFRDLLFRNIYYVVRSAWTGGLLPLVFAPLENVAWLWLDNSIYLPEGTYFYAEYDLGRTLENQSRAVAKDPNWYFVIFSTVFLTFPLTIFCFYIYEPQWSRTFRPKLWRRMWRMKDADTADDADLPSPTNSCEEVAETIHEGVVPQESVASFEMNSDADKSPTIDMV